MRTYRLAWLAAAFAVGISLAGLSGPLAVAPIPWLAGACAVGLWCRGRGPGLVVAIALVGAGTSAWDANRLSAGRTALLIGATADDREFDFIAGVVVGPVEQAPGKVSFLLATGGPVVRVTAARGRESSAIAPSYTPLPGDRVQVVGRLSTPQGYQVPGAFDRRRWAASRGAALELHALARDLRMVGAEASGYRWPARWQRRLSARIQSRDGSSIGRAVVASMVAGDRGAVPREVSDRFRDAGVAHVLAVSGLHLGATALLAFLAIRRLWAAVPALALRADAYRAAAIGAAPIAVAYTLLTGARVSTVRALIVVLIMLAGALLRRRPRLLDSLGAAALVLLAVAPATLFDPSFQLSFGATTVLALVVRGRTAVAAGEAAACPGQRWTRWLRGPWELMRASLWVSVALAPLTAASFGVVQTGGPVANLVVVPLAELVVLPCGLAGAAVAELWPAGGGFLIDVAVEVASWLDVVAGHVGHWCPALRVPPPSLLEWCAWLLAVGGAIAAARSGWRSRRALASVAVGVGLLGASMVVTTVVLPRLRTGVTVTFLDVGQGDATVIELPGGGTWLIDTGGRPFVSARRGESSAERTRRAASPGQQAVVPFLMSRRIRRLELVVISHAHPDHFAGLSAISQSFPIDELWIAKPHPEQWSPQLAVMLCRLRLAGTRVVHPPLGAATRHRGAALEVIGPEYEAPYAQVDPVLSVNDNSLVVALRFAGRSVLFAGDLEAEGEAALLPRLGQVDVVKVAHHGSPTSSTAPFVKATQPSWAVVSCGRANRFGFPDSAVLDRWRRVGAQLWRTDVRGSASFRLGPDGRMDVAEAE